MEPKIRLKGFSGDWKCSNVGSECDVLTGFPFDGADICLSGDYMLMRGINITEGVLRHSDDIDRYYTGDLSSLMKYRLRLNDLVISMDGSKVGKNSALVTSKEVDSLLVQRVARLRSDEINTVKLLFVKISSGAFFDYVQKKKTASAIPHISPSDIKNFPISLPVSNEERSSLSNYFTHLDTLISSTSRRLEKLRAVKAASLQSMFPQEGEKEPRVRFKGFSGEWVKVQLGDIATFSKGHGYSKNDIIKTGTPIILYGSLYTKYQFAINGVNTFAKLAPGSVLSEGNEVVIPASGETTEDIARASAVLKPNVIIGGDLNVLSFDLTKFSTPFIALIITNGAAHYTLSKSAQGKTVVHLNNGEIRKASIYLPSLPEQTAIANYFTHLDDLIQSTSRRLDKLRAVKAACLEGMFV
ncbi:MAG: restriction endonuclease subunit S [Bacteroidales bacterium]|nr:restriction endonuclease subunit S [Bacteroidales bacterium]